MKEFFSYQENRFLYFTWQMFLSYEDISSHGIDTVRLRGQSGVSSWCQPDLHCSRVLTRRKKYIKTGKTARPGSSYAYLLSHFLKGSNASVN